MTRILALLAALVAFSLPARAQTEDIVADLSQNAVNITATFVGSEILIFGAVKRESPAPTDSSLEVVVVVEGPSHPITVRRKEKRFGIWVNTDAVEVDAAPSFYAVASSAPLATALTATEDLRHHVSIPQAIHMVGETEHAMDIENFAEAIIRIKSRKGLYMVHEGAVEVNEDTLFSTAIELPANLTEGHYKARIYLTRNGNVVANYETGIEVAKVGIERWLYNLAHDLPLIYGLMSLFIAVAAGWGASAAFRVFLRS